MSRLFAEYDRADRIGDVVDALQFESFRKIAKKTLLRLFPLLNEVNADLISAEQYSALYRELFECDAAFTIAVLQMLVAVHDTSAIPHVERLSKGAGCLGKRYPLVREAASQCLEALQNVG